MIIIKRCSSVSTTLQTTWCAILTSEVAVGSSIHDKAKDGSGAQTQTTGPDSTPNPARLIGGVEYERQLGPQWNGTLGINCQRTCLMDNHFQIMTKVILNWQLLSAPFGVPIFKDWAENELPFTPSSGHDKSDFCHFVLSKAIWVSAAKDYFYKWQQLWF